MSPTAKAAHQDAVTTRVSHGFDIFTSAKVNTVWKNGGTFIVAVARFKVRQITFQFVAETGTFHSL